MIEVINDCGLHPVIMKALQYSANTYSQGLKKVILDDKSYDVFTSASRLMLPPKIFWYQKKLDEDGTQYASALLHSLEGNVWHSYFETVLENDPQYITEKRLYLPVKDTEYCISGQLDLYDKVNNTLLDYKNMSSAKFLMALGLGKYNGLAKGFPEYEMQQNEYAAALKYNEYPVDKAELLIRIRDWDTKTALRNPSLNQKAMFETVDIKLWTDQKVNEFIKSRIEYYLQYKDRKLDDIPECTMQDRWENSTKWKVYAKKKNSTSFKQTAETGAANFKSEEDAKEYIVNRCLATGTKYNDFKIVYFKGEATRCKYYCDLAKRGKCNWWNNNKDSYE